jgi:hypothetical protein
MSARIDHVTMLARDLDEATARFTRLGFTVTPGGPLADTGMRNALVLLGNQYIELLALDRVARAAREELGGPTLVQLFEQHEGGPLGYSVTGEQSDQVASRNSGTRGISGLTVDGPFTMRRQLHGGGEIAWRTWLPGGIVWRRPWPALIEWETADAERERLEPTPAHANGVTGIASVTLAVANLGTAVMIYLELLEFAPPALDEVPALGASRATFAAGGGHIYLLQNAAKGLLADWLAAWGEGPFEVTLASADLERTRQALEETGLAATDVGEWPERVRVAPDAVYGMRLGIEPARTAWTDHVAALDASTPVG